MIVDGTTIFFSWNKKPEWSLSRDSNRHSSYSSPLNNGRKKTSACLCVCLSLSLSLPIFLFPSISICLFLSIPICLFQSVYFSLSLSLLICLFLSLFIYVCIYLSICLTLSLFLSLERGSFDVAISFDDLSRPQLRQTKTKTKVTATRPDKRRFLFTGRSNLSDF